MMKVVRNVAGFAVAYGPNDDNYAPVVPDGHMLTIEESPDLTPPPLTTYQEEEIKRRLLAEAIPKRDTLIFHLERFRVRAVEELAAAVGQPAIDAATAKKNAIDAAIAGLEGMFNDPRVVNAIDGAVAAAVKAVYLEIFQALAVASPDTYLALKALDPL